MCNTPEIAGVSATRDARWQAVIARDRNFDGQFYYAVRTTGVYCRPSCAARLAKPQNVSFYKTPKEAEHAGFRPCKRCRPREPALSRPNAAKSRGNLPLHRGRAGNPKPRRHGAQGRVECLSFSPALQGRYWVDTARLRERSSRRACPGRACKARREGHRRDL